MAQKKMNGLGKVLLPVAAVATGLVLWMAPQVSGQQGGSGAADGHDSGDAEDDGKAR